MTKYLKTLNPLIKNYYEILSEDFPEFLLDYIETPRMQQQDRISCSCGTYYSKMYNIELWYSSLEHSIAVALVIWHFTHDKKQTLAGLFHDISTPAFKHCIDFMNNDHENQESTEDLTRKMILESKEIMELLNRDNIKIDEVADYHIYPIADNDTPMLSADRLEYTLSNGLGQVKKIWDLNEVRKIYSNIIIVEKEDGTPEMCFKDKEVAERFVEGMSELSVLYMDDKRRFGMQLLADIMKRMSVLGIISVEDLYELSEEEVIEKIKNCEDYNISECFKAWQEGLDVKTSDAEIDDKYCINIKAKKRYINPLVITEDGIQRISDVSEKAKECISNCLSYTFDRYVYMDFDFDDRNKVLRKRKND
jgi:HD superfamily phosphohydrolase